MKCRELNLGNPFDMPVGHTVRAPSMKCRELNPGNRAVPLVSPCWCSPLNEVPELNPGNPSEGNAVGIAGGASMKCREVNPGNEHVKELGVTDVEASMKCREMNPGNGHIVAHTISRAAIENCERPNISHLFSKIIQDTSKERTSNDGALAPRRLSASAPRENAQRFSSRQK